MTILVAARWNHGIMLTADRMTSVIDSNGYLTGETVLTDKIAFVRRDALISIAGLTPVGLAVIETLQLKFLEYPGKVSFNDILEFTQRTIKSEFESFKKDNPDVFNPDFSAFLGGYDSYKNKYSLYLLSYINNFFPQKIQFYSAEGIERDRVCSYLKNKIGNADEATKLLSDSIRRINSPHVSKETLTLTSFYDPAEGKFNCKRVEIDQYGSSKEKQL
ncbi:hypothetical protein [Priestia megaterium]|uniref:hypothetical protein n=1 Tax=Priestia megaterium TaxID=1404 RepID=UPI000BF9C4BD|nr:hypothetical protein [Priestia megaterium]PFR93537.1 hypothetical protein COK39_17765 [Priestia megaterium]